MLAPGCPRCPRPVVLDGPGWACRDHGPVVPLWRPAEASYDAFVAHLERADGFPTLLPWPLGPGWHVSSFGVVAAEGGGVLATVTAVSGTTLLDGPVDVVVVSEEPGTGIGTRVARLPGDTPSDPGAEPPVTKVRVEQVSVPMWSVSTSAAPGGGSTDVELDRSVLVGEESGRWLWLLIRPASAMLLLRDEWILRDATSIGPSLVEVPFGGPDPGW
ncbi:DUF6758 family protein [Nocardioides sp. Soil805]|uniref:DUF6758 family protein n=1 Tax=Nocardioides sp. Soil805 TaxID=1736416 RepID=UPI0007024A43|nr:DUF6758 family protein [Nocardioides sp. Soil805]KRF30258.1 hypothetical protein ASG94_19800 [Nocardioides sp. Soil805]